MPRVMLATFAQTCFRKSGWCSKGKIINHPDLRQNHKTLVLRLLCFLYPITFLMVSVYNDKSKIKTQKIRQRITHCRILYNMLYLFSLSKSLISAKSSSVDGPFASSFASSIISSFLSNFFLAMLISFTNIKIENAIMKKSMIF